MENVPELLKEQVFIDFLNELEAQKYNVSYEIVNAADYGVPQRRKRLLLLASSEKQIKLIEPTHKKAVTVREAIADLSQVGAGEPNNRDKLHVAASLSKMNLDRIRYSIPGGTWRDWPKELILDCHRKKQDKVILLFMGECGGMMLHRPLLHNSLHMERGDSVIRSKIVH